MVVFVGGDGGGAVEGPSLLVVQVVGGCGGSPGDG